MSIPSGYGCSCDPFREKPVYGTSRQPGCEPGFADGPDLARSRLGEDIFNHISADTLTLKVGIDDEFANIDFTIPLFDTGIATAHRITQKDFVSCGRPCVSEKFVLVVARPRSVLADDHIAIGPMMNITREVCVGRYGGPFRNVHTSNIKEAVNFSARLQPRVGRRSMASTPVGLHERGRQPAALRHTLKRPEEHTWRRWPAQEKCLMRSCPTPENEPCTNNHAADRSARQRSSS